MAKNINHTDDTADLTAQIDSNLEVSETTETPTQEETPSKIKVGEKEYSQEELDRIVQLGEIGVEAESKFNTKIGNVWPEYTKSREEIKQLKEELESMKQGKGEVINDDENRDQVIQAARKYGLMTQEDVRAFYAEQKAADKLLDEVEKLEGSYNGSDGRPKFDKIDILTYMRDNGINNPETAYKVKFEKELDDWREKKISSAAKTNIVTNTATQTGSKQPEDVKPTRDNLEQLINESLGV